MERQCSGKARDELEKASLEVVTGKGRLREVIPRHRLVPCLFVRHNGKLAFGQKKVQYVQTSRSSERRERALTTDNDTPATAGRIISTRFLVRTLGPPNYCSFTVVTETENAV